MSIDRAIEAAAEAMREHSHDTWEELARIAVEAAAPYLSDRAWTDAMVDVISVWKQMSEQMSERAERAEAEVKRLCELMKDMQLKHPNGVFPS